MDRVGFQPREGQEFALPGSRRASATWKQEAEMKKNGAKEKGGKKEKFSQSVKA